MGTSYPHLVSRTKHTILLAEDEPASELLTLKVLETGEFPVDVHVTRNGGETWDFLKDAAKPRPDLVLLDLCMPVMDGMEVLRRVRSHECLRLLPVVVLSSANLPLTIREAYLAGANAFVAKGQSLAQLREDLAATLRFWLKACVRPSAAPVAEESGTV